MRTLPARVLALLPLGSLLLILLVAGSALHGRVRAQRESSYDVLIRHARVMDGTGNPWVRADVGVTEGRIAAIGSLKGATGARVIEATDRLVTPGFIDVHSHAAEGLSREVLRQGQPLIAQGITTILANPDAADRSTSRPSAFNWRRGIGPNVVLFIGHGTVRRQVLGMSDREPTGDELERMKGFVRKGMEDGGRGLSTGLYYAPGSYAKTEEVIAPCR